MSHPYAKEKELIERCVKGDKTALEEFVRTYSDLVYRSIQHILVLRRIRYTRQDIEDYHNTVFLHLLESGCRKLSQYEGRNGCSPGTWIRTVTIRVVLNHIRKNGPDSIRFASRKVPVEEIRELSADTADAQALLDAKNLKNAYENALVRLSGQERLLMRIHMERDVELSETAQILGITIQNAYTVKHRALKKLKSILKETAT